MLARATYDDAPILELYQTRREEQCESAGLVFQQTSPQDARRLCGDLPAWIG